MPKSLTIDLMWKRFVVSAGLQNAPEYQLHDMETAFKVGCQCVLYSLPERTEVDMLQNWCAECNEFLTSRIVAQETKSN